MCPRELGAVLGIANLFVIALGIGAMFGRDEMSGIAMFVVMVGFIPAIFAGSYLGWLAHGWRSYPPWMRLLVLTVPAVAVVFSLAAVFDLVYLAPVSCIPTLVATLVLERRTREEVSPLVPMARARTTR